MENIYQRSAMILGEKAIEKLKSAKVIVFGAGGVGSYAVEALSRAGVGSIDIVDGDCYSPSNLNRQLYANMNTIGQNKAKAAREAVMIINPECKVYAISNNFNDKTEALFDFSKYDYIIDAIDTVTDKVRLIKAAKASGTPIISSMGAGNKLDPTKFAVADIYQTRVCPLARVMRSLLKKENIKELKTVYSTEQPIIKEENGRTPGSVSFVPSVAGLIIAGEVIKDLIK